VSARVSGLRGSSWLPWWRVAVRILAPAALGVVAWRGIVA
jgi:hypothetical protein